MECQFLLRLMMSFELPNNLCHPSPVVAALSHYDAVMHNLDPNAVALRHRTGVGDLCNDVGITNRDGQRNPPLITLRISLMARHTIYREILRQFATTNGDRDCSTRLAPPRTVC